MSERMGVRLYGMSRTNTSWGRVTAGVREGLEAIGAFAGFVPVDDLDGDAPYAGAHSQTAIFVGPPSMLATMTSYGVHDRRFAILAPNSSWLPRDLLAEMVKYAELVAPSTWGARVLAEHVGYALPPYFHGVAAEFAPSHAAMLRNIDDWENGVFRVLHLASTHRQRKGTRELLAAWDSLARDRDRWVGHRPWSLDIVADAPEGTFCEGTTLGLDSSWHRSIAFPSRQLNLPAAAMSALMQRYHLVCQPSRAEGFGLSPLEARASGVPVCATACTGHADHVLADDPGVVVVRTGPDEPVDDAPIGEISLAPSLSSADVGAALLTSFRDWGTLQRDAYAAASDVREKWSWAAVTEQWLRKVGIEWI